MDIEFVYPIEDYLNGTRGITTKDLKNRLVYEGIKKDECEICGCLPVWNGKELRLELHHKDGNNNNNNLDNLQILCPNCHTQTTNYANKQHEPPSLVELKSMLSNNSKVYVSKYYNVSEKTLNRWLLRLKSQEEICQQTPLQLLLKQFVIWKEQFKQLLKLRKQLKA